MAKCIICGERPSAVPDRNTLSSRKKICTKCNAERLRDDLRYVLTVEKKRKEKC